MGRLKQLLEEGTHKPSLNKTDCHLTPVQEGNVVVLNARIQQVLALEDVVVPGMKELQFPEAAFIGGHARVPRGRLLKVVVQRNVGSSQEVEKDE